MLVTTKVMNSLHKLITHLSFIFFIDHNSIATPRP